uniref:CSON003467 protein n=1 Tax=Culicoides sonorensis TaxID=179676 RepID=A0A336MMN6_CULSO
MNTEEGWTKLISNKKLPTFMNFFCNSSSSVKSYLFSAYVCPLYITCATVLDSVYICLCFYLHVYTVELVRCTLTEVFEPRNNFKKSDALLLCTVARVMPFLNHTEKKRTARSRL